MENVLTECDKVKDSVKPADEQLDAKEMRLAYKGTSYDDAVRKAFQPVVLTLKSHDSNYIEEYDCVCKRCGHTWESRVDRNMYYYHDNTCKRCGNELEIFVYPDKKSYWDKREVKMLIYDTPASLGNDLLLRLYQADVDANETIVHEIGRIFAYREKRKVKLLLAQRLSSGKWEAVKRNRTGDWFAMDLIQSKDEIRNIIERSALAGSGFIEAIGVGDKHYKAGLEPENPISYILKYTEYPSIELVAKGNVPNMLRSICFDKNACMRKGKNLHEVLGLSKNALKITRELDLNYHDAHDINRLLSLDPSITSSSITKLNEAGISVEQYILLRTEMPIPLESVIAYMDNCYNYQYIEVSEAMQHWIDYIRMAKRCKFDLNDKSRRFPSSLKKEHDCAVFVFKKIKEEISQKKFEERAKNNKHLEYSYGDYFVKIPETPNDVVAEATAQHNCLRSYIERISSGKSIVAFVRKKEEPDKSYVTVEITPEMRIVQVKGYCNSEPQGRKLNEFFTKWSAAKKLYNTVRIA